jgi:hypothetical protein
MSVRESRGRGTGAPPGGPRSHNVSSATCDGDKAESQSGPGPFSFHTPSLAAAEYVSVEASADTARSTRSNMGT